MPGEDREAHRGPWSTAASSVGRTVSRIFAPWPIRSTDKPIDTPDTALDAASPFRDLPSAADSLRAALKTDSRLPLPSAPATAGTGEAQQSPASKALRSLLEPGSRSHRTPVLTASGAAEEGGDKATRSLQALLAARPPRSDPDGQQPAARPEDNEDSMIGEDLRNVDDVENGQAHLFERVKTGSHGAVAEDANAQADERPKHHGAQGLLSEAETATAECGQQNDMDEAEERRLRQPDFFRYRYRDIQPRSKSAQPIFRRAAWDRDPSQGQITSRSTDAKTGRQITGPALQEQYAELYDFDHRPAGYPDERPKEPESKAAERIPEQYEDAYGDPPSSYLSVQPSQFLKQAHTIPQHTPGWEAVADMPLTVEEHRDTAGLFPAASTVSASLFRGDAAPFIPRERKRVLELETPDTQPTQSELLAEIATILDAHSFIRSKRLGRVQFTGLVLGPDGPKLDGPTDEGRLCEAVQQFALSIEPHMADRLQPFTSGRRSLGQAGETLAYFHRRYARLSELVAHTSYPPASSYGATGAGSGGTDLRYGPSRRGELRRGNRDARKGPSSHPVKGDHQNDPDHWSLVDCPVEQEDTQAIWWLYQSLVREGVYGSSGESSERSRAKTVKKDRAQPTDPLTRAAPASKPDPNSWAFIAVHGRPKQPDLAADSVPPSPEVPDWPCLANTNAERHSTAAAQAALKSTSNADQVSLPPRLEWRSPVHKDAPKEVAVKKAVLRKGGSGSASLRAPPPSAAQDPPTESPWKSSMEQPMSYAARVRMDDDDGDASDSSSIDLSPYRHADAEDRQVVPDGSRGSGRPMQDEASLITGVPGSPPAESHDRHPQDPVARSIGDEDEDEDARSADGTDGWQVVSRARRPGRQAPKPSDSRPSQHGVVSSLYSKADLRSVLPAKVLSLLYKYHHPGSMSGGSSALWGGSRGTLEQARDRKALLDAVSAYKEFMPGYAWVQEESIDESKGIADRAIPVYDGMCRLAGIQPWDGFDGALTEDVLRHRLESSSAGRACGTAGRNEWVNTSIKVLRLYRQMQQISSEYSAPISTSTML